MEGTLFAFSKLYYIFQHPIVIFQTPPCNKIKRAFKCWNIIFQIIWNYCFYQLFYYWFSFFCFVKNVTFYFVLEKPSWFESISVSISLIFCPLRIFIFQYFTCQDKCSFLSLGKLTNIFINFFCVTVISNDIIFCISFCRS